MKFALGFILLGFLLSGLLILSGCGGGGIETVDDLNERRGENLGGEGDPFETDRVLDVHIQMSPADFQSLKAEGRSLAATARSCPPDFDYTEFDAAVVIDGTMVSDIRVRKKGFLGSLSPDRPSFKLDFNDRVKGQKYQGLKGMTLNNNRQDASNLRQCLAYDLFRQQGLPAPRCNFARVSVNGEPLGIYTHVEAVNKDFMETLTGFEQTPLYESEAADFTRNLIARLDIKHDSASEAETELSDLLDALEAEDEEFLSRISAVVDIDQFIRFWATETVLGFWDSASGNANNFYVYRDPASERLRFIPWGADTALVGFHLLKPGSGPLFRNLRLAERLFEQAETQARYLDQVRTLLNQYWNAEATLSRINAWGALTGTPDADLEPLRVYVRGTGLPGDSGYIAPARERLITAIERSEFSEQVQLTADLSPDCDTAVAGSRLRATLNVNGGSDSGQIQFNRRNGRSVSASVTLAATEVDSITRQRDVFTQPQGLGLTAIGADVFDAYRPYVLQVFLQTSDWQVGEWPLHGFARSVLLFAVDESKPLGIRTIGMGDDGLVRVVSASGDPESGDMRVEVDVSIEFLPGEG